MTWMRERGNEGMVECESRSCKIWINNRQNDEIFFCFFGRRSVDGLKKLEQSWRVEGGVWFEINSKSDRVVWFVIVSREFTFAGSQEG